MKILLPVSGIDDAKLIIDFVSNYHWPPHVNFKVIHVLGSSDTDSAVVAAESAGKAIISDIIVRLKTVLPAAQTCWELLHGSAIYEIVSAASDWEADMIVMGYRAGKDLPTLVAGSVSKGVVIQAPCSVAIIRPPAYNSESSARQTVLRARTGSPS